MAPADFRDRLLRGLGGDWPAPCPLNVEVRERISKPGYTIESVYFEAEPNDRVPAMLLIPDGVTATNPAPGICVWHEHAGKWHLGKSEPTGLAGNPMHHTGVALAQQGYVVLCPDALCFGERSDPTGRLKDSQYERFEFLRYIVQGKCLAWKHILDMRRAVDLLAGRAEVRSDQLGCYGFSMGSTHCWLVGPWEPRLKCIVATCCLPTYKAIHREHMLHCFPNFIPGIFPDGDTPDIAALIAPRPLLMNFGETDSGSPIDEVRAGIPIIQRAYDSMHAGDNFESYIELNTGHVLSPTMWEKTKNWFAKHLKS